MRYDEHTVPAPLRDEDKWWKLTKRQWIIILPSVLLALGICALMKALHMLPIGIAIAVLIVMGAGVVARMELPEEKYLYGSGVKLETLIIRIVWRKTPGNKKIYTKNLDNGYERWLKK